MQSNTYVIFFFAIIKHDSHSEKIFSLGIQGGNDIKIPSRWNSITGESY